MTIRSIVALFGCGLLLLPAAGAHGDSTPETILLHADFEDVAVGRMPAGPSPVGTIQKWIGAPGENMGDIGVVSKIDSASGGKVLQFTNVLHKPNRAPAVILNWPTPHNGVLSIEYRFMIPIDGPYLSICYIGGDWKTGATILMAGDGKLTVQYGEHDARINLGQYESNHWYTVRYELNIDQRTTDVFLDGRKRLNKLPWQPGAISIDKVNLYADFNVADHANEPVLQIDDVTVKILATR